MGSNQTLDNTMYFDILNGIKQMYINLSWLKQNVPKCLYCGKVVSTFIDE